MKKKVLVVGGGVGGLSAAIRLQSKGFQVRILEKNSRAGGRMNVISRQGYHFDTGPTIGLMPSEYRDLFSYAGKNMDDYIPMHRVDPYYSLFFPDGKRVRPSDSLGELTEYLESHGGNQVSPYLDYLSNTYRKFHLAADHFLYRSFHGIRDILNPKDLINLMKLRTLKTADREIRRYTSNEEIQKMLSFQTLYIGVSPLQGPSIYSIIPMIQNLYGVWFPRGGMAGVARGLERLFYDLGGVIETDREVTSAEFEKGQIRGVYCGREFFPSDQVIFNSDFLWTMEHLIPPELRKKYGKKKMARMDHSCSALLFYMGVRRKLEKLDTHNLFFARNFQKNLKDIFSGREMEDFSFYLYLSSKEDPSLAPPCGDSLYALIPVPNLDAADPVWDDNLISRYRERLLDRIAQSPAGDVREDLEFEEVWSPLTLRDKFHAPAGGAFGLAPTYFQSLFFRPQAKMKGLEGVYFTGCSTHPGAGVPIVMISGRIAAEELMSAAGQT